MPQFACWGQRQRQRMLAGACTLASAAVLALGQAAAAPRPLAVPAATTTTVDAVAAKQAEAARIALTLQDQGRRLDRLAEAFDRAQLNVARVTALLAATRTTMTGLDRQLQAQRTTVQRQAIADYVLGGQTAYLALTGGNHGSGFDDLARRHAYATTVAQAEYQAVLELRRLRRQMDESRRQMAKEQRAAVADRARISADRLAASAAAAGLQTTFGQVKGDLATMVVAEQARLADQQRARVLATLAAQRASLPPTSALARVSPAPPPLSTRRAPQTTSAVHVTPTTPTRPTIPTTTTTIPPPPPPPGGNRPARGWQIAVAAAAAELGKPYQWGAAGPDSFDCSGLVMWSWAKAGVGLLHLAQDQYAATRRIAIADLLRGDLVFYGTPSNVHHVGIYVGGGTMIEAPETGDVVKYSTIYFDGLLAGGRIID
jgi:peptidoglycan DL-endopeptidase CwlO